MGGVTAVFEMPNTSPTTTSAQALADKIARAHHRMHCDFAFFIGGTRENTSELPALERLPGCAGVKVFMGSSTGSLLVEDDDSVRNILAMIRRRASFHSEDEYRLNERKHLRIDGDPRSHPVWRDEPPHSSARSGWSGWRARPASACMSCTSRPRRRWSFSRTTRTSRRSRPLRITSRSKRRNAMSVSARWRR
jgi:dihydroorotase-like cyclic amidohydrolase